jgi:stage II sporulation protein D
MNLYHEENEDGAGNADASPENRLHRLGMGLCFGGALMLIAVGLLGLTLSCCRPSRRRVGRPPEYASPSLQGPMSVRVRLVEDARSLSVTTFSPFLWTSTESEWSAHRHAGTHRITATGSGLLVEGQSIPVRSLTITAPRNVFELNQRLYRGSLRVTLGNDGALIATEELPVEDYVRGVLPSEMPSRWPQQALMAQAVAARTFALHRALSSSGRSWISRLDLAYRGVDGESRRSDRAVRETRGTVLEWSGRPLPAFFHSTCGGHTASAVSVFGGPDIPPLTGVPCQWDEDSPQYRWTCTLSLSEIAEKLKPRGITRVTSIQTGDRTRTGRLEHVVINGDKRIPTGVFRLEVGARDIKSTAFSLSREGNAVRFSGKGWGHGVGMCQWGAHGMAEGGYSWRGILEHYYPGAKLTSIAELPQLR